MKVTHQLVDRVIFVHAPAVCQIYLVPPTYKHSLRLKENYAALPDTSPAFKGLKVPYINIFLIGNILNSFLNVASRGAFTYIDLK